MTDSKQRKKLIRDYIRHPFEAAIAYGFYGLCKILPVDIASNMGGMIGRAIGPSLGMSKTARENLKRFLPALSPRQHQEIITEIWDNLGRIMAEYPHLSFISAPENQRLEIIGIEETKRILADHPSSIFFSGHFANWEVLQQAAKIMDVPMTMIYRRPNNPHVEKLLMKARGGTDTTHIAKGHSGARRAMSVLKNQGAIAMLVDQKMNEGLPIPFFGSLAMTAPAIAHFAMRFDCPVIPTRIERLKGAHFRVTLLPPLYIDKEINGDAAIERMLIDINNLLESWIRETPGQWLWLHRRWGKFFNQ